MALDRLAGPVYAWGHMTCIWTKHSLTRPMLLLAKDEDPCILLTFISLLNLNTLQAQLGKC